MQPLTVQDPALVNNFDRPLLLERNPALDKLDIERSKVDGLQESRTQMPMDLNRRADDAMHDVFDVWWKVTWNSGKH
jgi:hypothetical protein